MCTSHHPHEIQTHDYGLTQVSFVAHVAVHCVTCPTWWFCPQNQTTIVMDSSYKFESGDGKTHSCKSPLSVVYTHVQLVLMIYRIAPNVRRTGFYLGRCTCRYRIVRIISPWAIFFTSALNRGWAYNTSGAYSANYHNIYISIYTYSRTSS